MKPISERAGQRTLHAFAAQDTIEVIVERMINLVSSGRRMTMVEYYGDSDSSPRVQVGLTLDPTAREKGLQRWTSSYLNQNGISFYLTPGIGSFGVSSSDHTMSEDDVAEKYHAGRCRHGVDLVRVEIVGGTSGDPRDVSQADCIHIRRLNEHGVTMVTEVYFDTPESSVVAEREAGLVDLLARNAPDGAWTKLELEELAHQMRYHWETAEQRFAQTVDEDVSPQG